MDIDRILSLLKKDLEYFGADHTISKIELYRKYQKYLKIWKLDNFETIDEKLNASKNIEKTHKAYKPYQNMVCCFLDYTIILF